MKIGIIYMAGGNGRRYAETSGGMNKLLIDVNGKRMFRWGLDTIAELQKELIESGEKQIKIDIVVVTQYEEIRSECNAIGVRCLLDKDCRLGASYTVRAGLKAIDEFNADYSVFMTADQPGITKETIYRLISETVKNGTDVGCVSYAGDDCNPCIFKRSLNGELMALEGDRGGKKVFKNHLDSVTRVVALSESEITDIDYSTK